MVSKSDTDPDPDAGAESTSTGVEYRECHECGHVAPASFGRPDGDRWYCLCHLSEVFVDDE